MSSESNRQTELLAPAGSQEALRAAVAAGADAVYLGLDQLNARRGAENFTIDELAEACDYAHLRGVRVYLTLNVLILPSEMEQAVEMVDAAWSVGVDAVIVQDVGLLRVVRQALPHVRMHASTQINAHSSSTVGVLARASVSRITLARETSIDQIGALVGAGERAAVEIESFVHGAICVCYSGGCLLSSVIGGRSANRGSCAQPCRLPYELVDEKNKVIETDGAHLLSPKDLAGLPVLDRLVATGVAAIKVEGRMKSAEYVALVTGVYRKALDRASDSDAEYTVREGEMEVLNEAFSRGFTHAYLEGERGNDMMSYRRPNNRGVAVGRVASTAQGSAVISLEIALDADDTIEVWTSRGRFAQTVGRLQVEGSSVRVAPAGSKATVRVSEPVSTGDRVFRVRNAALAQAAARTFSGSGGADVPVDIRVRMVIGEPLEIEATDGSGRTGRAVGPRVESARTRPVSTDDVMEHVGRLGGTAYAVADWDIVLSPDAGIGFSVLHRVRREAIEALSAMVLEPWSSRERTTPRLPYLPTPATFRDPAPRLIASVSNVPTAKACLQAGCESAYVPPAAIAEWALTATVPPGVVPMLPRVVYDVEAGPAMASVAAANHVGTATLGTLVELAEKGAQVDAHWSLNALNAFAVAELAELGAGFVWLSPELSSRQIRDIAREAAVPVGIAVSGRQELMVTAHCILMSEGSCSGRCATCRRRQGWRFLRDRKGYSFPIKTDELGRSHVFNSVPLDLTHALPEVLATGVAALRLDLETEPANRAAAEVARVRQALQDALAGRESAAADRSKVTAGHFFRGV